MSFVLTSGSAVTPQGFHFKSPRLNSNELTLRQELREKGTHLLVFSRAPIHLPTIQFHVFRERQIGRTEHPQMSRQ